MKTVYDKISKYTSLILLIVFMTILYIVFLLKSQDNDMFFEIMSGRDILNGNFHTISHMNNFPIIVQQWLYAVCLAITDKFGTVGNIGFVLVQNIMLCSLSYVFINIKTHNKPRAIIGSIFALLYCHDYMINVRPQIITAICLVAQLIFIELYKEKKQIRYLLPIFPILILSANMHQAVFLYHGFVMIPYFYKKEKPFIDWKLVAFTPFFMACSLLTPYGLDGSLYIVRTFMSHTYEIIGINEILPVSFIDYVGIKMFLLCGVTIFCIYRQKSNYFANFFTFSVTILTLISARHISIMIIPVLFLLCTIEDFKFLHTVYARGCMCLICIAMCLLFVKHTKDIRYDYGPVVNAIEEKDAMIYNTAMDLGGWLEYNGCTKIKLDSRCEAFSEEISGVPNVMTDYLVLSQGYRIDMEDYSYTMVEDEEILELVEDYRYVVSKKNQYVNRTLNRNPDEWIKIFDDDVYTVYIHND